MRIAVTDIEANNLYLDVDLFHCAFIYDVTEKKMLGFRPHQLKEYCQALSEYDVVVGHNVIDYDCAALKKLNGELVTKGVFDTLVLSRILEPDRIQGHSLDSWGRALGCHKGDYGKQDNAWETFTEAMYEYCEQDVLVTFKLYCHLCQRAGFDYLNPPSINFDWSEY